MISTSSDPALKDTNSCTSTGWNFFYTLATHQEFEASLDIIANMLHLFSHNVYYFFEIGSTLLCVTPYVAMYFGFGPKNISHPFLVSTPVGHSIVSRKIFEAFVLSIFHREILVDLVELDMVDFNFILGMDWIYSCYTSLDCRTQKVTFYFPN